MSPPDHPNSSLVPIMSQELDHALCKVVKTGLGHFGISGGHGELLHKPNLRLFNDFKRKLSWLMEKSFRGFNCMNQIIFSADTVREDLNVVLRMLNILLSTCFRSTRDKSFPEFDFLTLAGQTFV